MSPAPAFDPFHNRLCRDIRNALSQSFIGGLRRGDLSPVLETAKKFRSEHPPPFMLEYMDDRLKRYREIFEDPGFQEAGRNRNYRTACSLWNRRLFFECHEWLELSWQEAAGEEKRMIQALIRSAGAYLLFEAGREKGARRLADKAAAGLRRWRSRVPKPFDVERLIAKLTALDGAPPRFSC